MCFSSRGVILSDTRYRSQSLYFSGRDLDFPSCTQRTRPELSFFDLFFRLALRQRHCCWALSIDWSHRPPRARFALSCEDGGNVKEEKTKTKKVRCGQVQFKLLCASPGDVGTDYLVSIYFCEIDPDRVWKVAWGFSALLSPRCNCVRGCEVRGKRACRFGASLGIYINI